MKTWIHRIQCLTVCLAVTLGCVAQEKITLEVYHTNDMHSRVEPMPAHYPDSTLAGRAGLVRRVTFMEQARRQDPELILLDCGDFSQGSPYYNLFKGSTEVEFMNLCGYDAGTIGNHEFDFGLENMARLFREARFPILIANFNTAGTLLEGVVKPYTILFRKGLKVGVFGVSTQMDGLVQQKNIGGLVYRNAVEAANEVAAFLKEQEHCDVVICISHLGWEETPRRENPDDHYLALHSRHIDVILGGHSHTYFEQPKRLRNLDGQDVVVNQMGKHAAFVGHLTLTFEKK